MKKTITFFILLPAILVVCLLGGCHSPTPPSPPTLIEAMVKSAREILQEEYPQYDLKLMAIFASVSEEYELFENADELAYWRFVFTDFSAHKSVEVFCTDSVWSSELIDDVWFEDAILEPINIKYDIQDALDKIGDTYPGGKYYGVYFHQPIYPGIEHSQYKFHRESYDFIIFDTVTGDFYISPD